MNLLDSNVIIEASAPGGERFTRWFETDDFAVSVITRIEVLGYHALTSSEHACLNRVLAAAEILPLDDRIAERTIALRQAKRIKLADAIIAATALEHDLPLVTRNRDDFLGIQGLRMLDPLSA